MKQLRKSIPQHIGARGRKQPPATQYFILIAFRQDIYRISMIELIMLHSIVVRYLPAQPVMKDFVPQTIHSDSRLLIQGAVSMLRKHNLSHYSAPIVG